MAVTLYTAKRITLLVAAAMLVALCGTAWAGALITDTFNRTDSTILGTTEDAAHYPWLKAPNATNDNMQISGNRLYLGGDDLTICGATVDTLEVLDFDMTVDVQAAHGAYDGWYGFVSYRSNAPCTEDSNGFRVEWKNGWLCLFCYAAGGHQAAIDPGVDFFAAPHTIRIKVVGQQHQCWLDGDLKWDLTIPYMGSGYTIGLTHRHMNTYYDNFSLENLDTFVTLKGTVTDQNTSLPVSDVQLTCGAQTQTTGSDGKYQFDGLVAGPLTLTARKDGYYPFVKSFTGEGGTTMTEDISFVPVGAPTAVVFDTFTRTDNVELGTTEDAGAYPWQKPFPTDAIQISSEMMSFTSAGTGASVTGFFPKDFEVSAKVTSDASMATGTSGISYRGKIAGSNDGAGYSVMIDSGTDPQIMTLSGHGEVLETAEVPVYIGDFWSIPGPTLKIKAVDRHHQVYVNDTLFIDYLDTSDKAALGGGFVTLINNNVPALFDDLNINSWQDAKAGSVTGYVYAGGSGVAGAEVAIAGIASTLSGAGGAYSLTGAIPGTSRVSASYPGYLPDVKSVAVPADASIAQDFTLQAIPDGMVVDTFTRDANDTLGTTEDTAHIAWMEDPAYDSATTILDHQLQIASSAGNNTYIGVTPDAQYADVDIEADVTMPAGATNAWAGICYRAHNCCSADNDLGLGATGYLCHMSPTGVLYLWRAATGHLAGIATGIDPTATRHWKIRAIGNRHMMWIDGQLMYDITDNNAQAFSGSGYINFCRCINPALFDNMTIKPAAYNDVDTNGAKALADGALVRLSGQIVTCKRSDFVYVEESSRASGIKVLASTGLSVGDAVDIEGEMGTTDTERHIVASKIIATSGGNVVKPVAVNGRTADAAQGLSPIGLLVGVSGEVKVVNEGAHHIAIQDGGSDPWVILAYPDGTTLPTVGDYVVGFGALGLPPGNTNEKIVWMRTPDDIQKAN